MRHKYNLLFFLSLFFIQPLSRVYWDILTTTYLGPYPSRTLPSQISVPRQSTFHTTDHPCQSTIQTKDLPLFQTALHTTDPVSLTLHYTLDIFIFSNLYIRQQRGVDKHMDIETYGSVVRKFRVIRYLYFKLSSMYR